MNLEQLIEDIEGDWDFFSDTVEIRCAIKNAVAKPTQFRLVPGSELYAYYAGAKRVLGYNRVPGYLKNHVKDPLVYGELFVFSGSEYSCAPVEKYMDEILEYIKRYATKHNVELASEFSLFGVAAMFVLRWANAGLKLKAKVA